MTAQFKKGFTLIELLIVMAVIGVLAVVVLVAINPVQQLARTRDTGRKSAVTQMGHALSAYYTAQSGLQYVAESGTWMDELLAAGEIGSIPSLLMYSANTGVECTEGGVHNYYCYKYDASNILAIAYSRLESDSEEAKCTTGVPYFVWDSVQGRAGIVCSASEPAASTGGVTFQD